MKMTLTITALALATATAFGQGSLAFSNAGGARIDRTSTGAAVPKGMDFVAALYFAEPNVPDEAFDLAARQVGAVTGFAPVPGFFNGGGRTIDTPGFGRGAVGKFQVRVWETVYGANYDLVVATGNPEAEVGKSRPFLVDTADYLGGEAPASMGTLMPAFLVTPVPEPSVIGLGLLGVGALLMLRRRK